MEEQDQINQVLKGYFKDGLVLSDGVTVEFDGKLLKRSDVEAWRTSEDEAKRIEVMAKLIGKVFGLSKKAVDDLSYADYNTMVRMMYRYISDPLVVTIP